MGSEERGTPIWADPVHRILLSGLPWIFSFFSLTLLRKSRTWAADFLADKDSLLSLRSRLEQGRFHLAVLGQFKRGRAPC